MLENPDSTPLPEETRNEIVARALKENRTVALPSRPPPTQAPENPTASRKGTRSGRWPGASGCLRKASCEPTGFMPQASSRSDSGWPFPDRRHINEMKTPGGIVRRFLYWRSTPFNRSVVLIPRPQTFRQLSAGGPSQAVSTSSREMIPTSSDPSRTGKLLYPVSVMRCRTRVSGVSGAKAWHFSVIKRSACLAMMTS